jgi:hypothetical protein
VFDKKCVLLCAGSFNAVAWPLIIFQLTGLEKVWEVKPLINGKDIMNVLELKGGPLVKEWVSHSA